MIIVHNKMFDELYKKDKFIKKISYEIMFFNKEENSIEAHFYYEDARIPDTPKDLKNHIAEMCKNAKKNYNLDVISVRLLFGEFVWRETGIHSGFTLSDNVLIIPLEEA